MLKIVILTLETAAAGRRSSPLRPRGSLPPLLSDYPSLSRRKDGLSGPASDVLPVPRPAPVSLSPTRLPSSRCSPEGVRRASLFSGEDPAVSRDEGRCDAVHRTYRTCIWASGNFLSRGSSPHSCSSSGPSSRRDIVRCRRVVGTGRSR